MRIVARSNETEIILYDVIGEDFFGGVSAGEFHRELRAIDVLQPVTVRINSPGGSFFDAITMHTLLVERAGQVNVSIDGLAASAASIVAMAGETIEMADGARIMIHEPWMLGEGNASDMRAFADRLDSANDSMVGIYSLRTGQSTDKVRELLAAETWLSAGGAMELGFADGVKSDKAIAASIDRNVFSYRLPKNVPAKPYASKKRPVRREYMERQLRIVSGRRLGALIRRLLDEKDMSMEDLADDVGLDASTVSDIVTGEIQCPPIDRLESFAGALDVPVSRLRTAAESDGCSYGDNDS